MKKITSIALISISLTACATVFDGGSKNINITPGTGKKVSAEIHGEKGVERVTLPTVYNAKRSKEDIIVKIVDKCYEETSYVVQAEVAPAFFGNLLFGVFGLTGTTVDSNNGNLWKYDNNVIVPTNKKDGCK